VALLSIIRRWHLRDGMAIREIARRTCLSRNTIRKYLSTGIVEPKYPDRQSPSKLDRFAPKLAAWLKTESKKNRKQRRNLRQIYTDLTALGYEGFPRLDTCKTVAKLSNHYPSNHLNLVQGGFERAGLLPLRLFPAWQIQ